MPFEGHMNREVLSANVPAAGAAVAQDQAIGRAPFAGRVNHVAVFSEANVVATATNFRTLRVVNKGQDGNGSTVVATLALDTPGTDNLDDFDQKDIPLTANVTVAEGDVLVADETVTGTGLAHSGYRIAVELVR